MLHALIQITVILTVIAVMICLLTSYTYMMEPSYTNIIEPSYTNSTAKKSKCNCGMENYWPYSNYSDGHYWQSAQTFNNSNRYFDYMPYLGVYRLVDLGKWKK